MKRRIKIMSGLGIFALALILNVQYAIDGYGFKSDPFFINAFATGGSGSTPPTSGGWFYKQTITSSVCTSTTNNGYWMCAGVRYDVKPTGASADGCVYSGTTTTFTGVMARCDSGSDLSCTERCVGK